MGTTDDENIELFKKLVGNKLLSVTNILNSCGKKYRIERPGQKYPDDIMLGRIKLKIDENGVITSAKTG